MKTKNIVYGMLAMVFCLHSFIKVNAQISKNEKKELRKVSDTLYERHDLHYVIVDALIDGKIKLNAPYEYEVDSDRVIFNGETLSKHLRKRYLAKLKKFVEPDQSHILKTTYSGSGLSIQEVYEWALPNHNTDQTSMMQKFSSENSQRALLNGQAVKKEIHELLVNDGYFNLTSKVYFLYNKDGIFIDQKLLSPDKAKKYLQIFNSHGIILSLPTDRVQYNFEK